MGVWKEEQSIRAGLFGFEENCIRYDGEYAIFDLETHYLL